MASFHRVKYSGHIIDVPEEDLSMYVSKLVDAIHGAASAICPLHATGYADVLQTTLPHLHERLEELNTFLPYLKDNQINYQLTLLVSQMEGLSKIDQRLYEVIAAFFGVMSSSSGQDRKRLRKKIDGLYKKSLLPWLNTPEGRDLVEQSFVNCQMIDSLVLQIKKLTYSVIDTDYLEGNYQESRQDNVSSFPTAEHLLQWQMVTEEDVGDQRAKDLIDSIELEEDHKAAIRLLQRALRYGHTGIQASKAHFNIALRYEELDNYKLALKYYTKAIEAWKPDGNLWFYRGELYYKLGQLENAQHDLTQALRAGLLSPELEEAEDYMSELNKIVQKQ